MLERTSSASYRICEDTTATMNGDIDKNESAVKEKKGKLTFVHVYFRHCQSPSH